MSHTSASYKKLNTISSYLGKVGDHNGVTILVGTLPKNVVGNANLGSSGFTIDVHKLNNLPSAFAKANPGLSSSKIENAYGASAVAHESQHELDNPAYGGDPHTRSEFHSTEENAYSVQSAVGKALNVRIGLETNSEIQNAVEQSTNADCASSTPQC